MARKPEQGGVTGVYGSEFADGEPESEELVEPAEETPEPEPEAEVEPVVPPRMSSFDLIGEDGRRIVRWQPEAECKELQARILTTTGEETVVVESPAPVDNLTYPPAG